MRHYLAGIINETPGLRVVGEARNGEEALELAQQLRPDVISMDINMPRLDGLEATRRIMAQCPTPVVVVSSLVETDVDLSFQAIEAGALAVVEKPPDRKNPAFPEKQRQLVKTLAAMSGVRVIRRGAAARLGEDEVVRRSTQRLLPEVLAIGASAGGPSALATLLKGLPSTLAVPVVIVQHIPNEFVAGLARWLGKSSGLPVVVASDELILKPGVVHLSPGNMHLTLVRRGRKLGVKLLEERGVYRHHPAIDVLFESVAGTCGAAAVGVILTGMGDDGAAGLLAMRRAGAHTFAQDQASSTVFGMPNAAIERGGVEQVLSLVSLPAAIVKLL